MWSFIERDIASKLFQGFAFDFWMKKNRTYSSLLKPFLSCLYSFRRLPDKKINTYTEKVERKKIIKFFIRVETGNYKEKRIFTEYKNTLISHSNTIMKEQENAEQTFKIKRKIYFSTAIACVRVLFKAISHIQSKWDKKFPKE
jgi:hypothetical protein